MSDKPFPPPDNPFAGPARPPAAPPVEAPWPPPVMPYAGSAGSTVLVPPELQLRSANVDLAHFGPEPLVAAAGRLIHLTCHIRNMPLGPDHESLRQLMVRELNAFAARAQDIGVAPNTVSTAHYILCAFIDSAVMSTPWGANSPWPQHKLSADIHNDAAPTERLIRLAERLADDPKREPRIIELLYCCLSLGFGRHSDDPQSLALLEQQRVRLHRAIILLRGQPGAELSPQRAGLNIGNRLRAALPLWVVLSALGLVALVIFAFLRIWLSSRADEALAGLSQQVGTRPIVAAPPAPETRTPLYDSLIRILAPDIASGRLQVLREGNDIVLRLINQGLFESGEAEPAAEYRDTFGRVAQALGQTQGRLRIEGHTDNQVVRSLPFPSNQELSEARATSVAAALVTAGVDRGRIETVGYADTHPVADNATADGRRQNRRVEIRVANEVAWR